MTTEGYRIAIVCSRLDVPGGIERAIVNTANLFQSKGHQVTILVLDACGNTFYPLNEKVRLLQLPLDFGITTKGNMITRKLRFVKHLSKLKQAFLNLQPQVIIGTEYSISIPCYLAGKKTGAKIFAWEHHHFYWLKKSRFWNYLNKKIYPRLTAIVCLNKTEGQLFQKLGCNTVVIPNFVSRQNRAVPNSKTILSVGWLNKRKGFEIIPQIAQKVFEKYPDWRWTIIGRGEEEALLKNNITKSRLQDHVLLLPPVSFNLETTYLDAAIYVMTSRFECFPMVLLEAMSHGVPAIAFDCPTGPSFIIRDKVDGLLIEQNNINAMAEAIMDLISNEEKRKAYGYAAYDNINRFSPDKVYALWQMLFNE